MEGSFPIGEPTWVSDGHLHLSPERLGSLRCCMEQSVPFWVAEHEQVQVIDRPLPVVSGESGCPRAEQVGGLDALDVRECFAEHRWRAERSHQDR